MKTVNVIIAKRDRDESLLPCLQSLQTANLDRQFWLNIYVVDDKPNYNLIKGLPIGEISNTCIFYVPVRIEDELFNKAKLLNIGLGHMRTPFDWVSVIDIDMVYNPNFFYEVEKVMTDKSYVISMGHCVDALEPSFLGFDYGERSPGTSQISMSENLYKLFLEIYGPKFYDELATGWGAEDSVVSFRAQDMQRAGLLKIERLGDMWLHLNHEKHTTDLNQGLFKRRRVEDPIVLKRWMSER